VSLSLFEPPVQRWFSAVFDAPTAAQAQGWQAIANGDSTLILAPTGSGKTLAAFLWCLNRLMFQPVPGERERCRVLYVSPLKALSNDIHKNLEEPLAGIREALRRSLKQDVEVRAEVRTGDTPAARRQAIAKRPPHILVTTPESLYLLLTSASGRRMRMRARAWACC